MSRQLYRVPLDFDWPLDKIWDGYLRFMDHHDKADGYECDSPDGVCFACAPSCPPPGAGYQMWETTSEGSPQSPVFKTLDALCEWCAENATTFGDWTASAAEWRAMFENGLVYHQEGCGVFI